MEMTPTLPTAATFLAETALKSVFVLLAALIALRLLRGAAPALRHRVALVAFVLLTLLPSLAFLPGIPVNALSGAFFARFAAPEASSVVETPLPSAAPRLPETPRPKMRPSPNPAPFAPPVAAPPRPPIVVTTLLCLIWAGITTAFLIPFALGLWRLRQLFHAASPADDRAIALTQQAAERLKIAPPAVRFSRAVSVPIAFGKDFPAIVLPDAAADWEDARLYAALLHESAHIARRDFGAQCYARIVCALYAWNPLVWKLYAVLRAEAEADCDARAVASGASSGLTAPEYAAHLFAIARQTGGGGTPFALAMTRPNRPHILEERIKMILTPCPGLRRRHAFLILSVAALCGVTVAGLRSSTARASDPPGVNPSPDSHFQTPSAPEAPPRNPVSFLKWSLRQYARAKTFSARWTWDL